MSPREVIARAIYKQDYDTLPSKFNKTFDSQPSFLQESYLNIADAVIDALAKMPVTDAMQEKAFKWEGSDDHVAVLWRAMVGAMRDE